MKTKKFNIELTIELDSESYYLDFVDLENALDTAISDYIQPLSLEIKKIKNKSFKKENLKDFHAVKTPKKGNFYIVNSRVGEFKGYEYGKYPTFIDEDGNTFQTSEY